MALICKEEEHNVNMELKIVKGKRYSKPVTVYLTNCTFIVYDSVQNISKKYFSKEVKLLMNGELESEDIEMDLIDEILTVYSPKVLSIQKPRFIKVMEPESKSRRSFISC